MYSTVITSTISRLYNIHLVHTFLLLDVLECPVSEPPEDAGPSQAQEPCWSINLLNYDLSNNSTKHDSDDRTSQPSAYLYNPVIVHLIPNLLASQHSLQNHAG